LVSDLLILTVVFTLYFILLYVFSKKKLLEKYDINLFGPIVMVHFHKGKDIIEKIARHKRFWTIIGSAAVTVCFVLSVLLIPLLVWNALLSFQLPVEAAPSPILAIGLPGVNPIMSGVNFWYAVVGLIIAIVVHETAHGVMARIAGVELKSVGLMFLVIPIGAFVEPDEEELKKVARSKRIRVFAISPFINIVLAIAFSLIFSLALMNMVHVKYEGVGVVYVAQDMPAQQVGIRPGMIITEIRDSTGTYVIRSSLDLQKYLSMKKVGDQITVKVYGGQSFNVTLASKAIYTKNASDVDKASLGIVMMDTREIEKIYDALRFPFSNVKSFINYAMLPFLELWGSSPLRKPYTDFLDTSIPSGLFWPLASTLYWIFWINLMLGITNSLPALPLDGGYVVREVVDWVTLKTKLSEVSREKFVSVICYTLTFFVAFLFILQFVGPYLRVIFS
jgi:membrane-associated protease RseP (regulator of RpoE activity)